MICKSCGDLKPIENRDLMLCASCNKDRREKPKFRKVYELPQVSKAKLAQAYQQGKALNYKKTMQQRTSKKRSEDKEVERLKLLRMQSVKRCETCGYTYRSKKDIDYSHVLPKSVYPEYATHPLNGLLECRPCHQVWTYGTASQRKAQASFKKKLMLAEQINSEFAEKMTKDELFKAITEINESIVI